MCECISELNKTLADQNMELNVAISSTGRIPLMPVLETIKMDRKKRGRAIVLYPTFCPFCGEKYELNASLDAVRWVE